MPYLMNYHYLKFMTIPNTLSVLLLHVLSDLHFV